MARTTGDLKLDSIDIIGFVCHCGLGNFYGAMDSQIHRSYFLHIFPTFPHRGLSMI